MEQFLSGPPLRLLARGSPGLSGAPALVAPKALGELWVRGQWGHPQPCHGCHRHCHPCPMQQDPPPALQAPPCFSLMFLLLWHLFNDKDLSKSFPPVDLILTRRQATASYPHLVTLTSVKIPFCPNFSLFPGSAVTPLAAGDGAVPSWHAINMGRTAHAVATAREHTRQMEPWSPAAAVGRLQACGCVAMSSSLAELGGAAAPLPGWITAAICHRGPGRRILHPALFGI